MHMVSGLQVQTWHTVGHWLQTVSVMWSVDEVSQGDTAVDIIEIQ